MGQTSSDWQYLSFVKKFQTKVKIQNNVKKIKQLFRAYKCF